MNLALGFFYGLLAQALTFAQLQGQFRYEWMKEHPLIVACIGGVPISLLYIFSVKHMVAHFRIRYWSNSIYRNVLGMV